MRIQCLLLDEHQECRQRLYTYLMEFSWMDVQSVDNYRDAITYIHTHHPNLILFRCGENEANDEKLVTALVRLKWRCLLVPILSQPDAQRIKSLARISQVVDILTHDADQERVQRAMSKIMDALSDDSRSGKYYRGFIGFVGLVPSLRERKILSDAGIGFIQNRSLRMAIDYWRKNPNMQLVGVAFDPNETFTSRMDELIENWDDFDMRPWEYGLFEAQKFYMEYWKVPIQEGLMSTTIPTMVREGMNNLTPVEVNEISRILFKIAEMMRMGNMTDIFSSMGISFRSESQTNTSKNYDEYIKKLQKQIEEVDRRHPELTRPPSETGYEGFQPDKASALQDGTQRMAFTQKKR